MRKRGTPKTLNQAIQNAFLDFRSDSSQTEPRLRKILKLHVQDWINNVMSPIVWDSDDLKGPAKRSLNKLAGRKVV